MKAYDESYSKIIKGHKYKYNDIGKDNDKDKETDKMPETTSIVSQLKNVFSLPSLWESAWVT